MGSTSIKQFLVLVIVTQVLISGCVSQKDQASERHRRTVETFKALSDYSESLILRQGVYVVGNIQHEVFDSRVRYTLRNIRLSNKENEYSFNLLKPSFYGKYSCAGVCVLINQYDRDLDSQGMTILERFFSENENALYTFYSDFYLLNKNLELMTEKNRYFVFSYLNHLVQNANTFSNIENFSRWFKSKTSLEAYTDYLSQVELISTEDIESFHVDFIESSLLTINRSNEANEFVLSNSLDEILVSRVDKEQLSFSAIETADELLINQSKSNTSEPEIAQYSDIEIEGGILKNTPDEQILVSRVDKEPLSFSALETADELLINQSKSNASELEMAQDLDFEIKWLILKTAPDDVMQVKVPTSTKDEQLIANFMQQRNATYSELELDTKGISVPTNFESFSNGMTLCTHQENYIGKVVSLETQRVILDLIGQAQYEELGVFKNYPSGMFNQVKQEVLIMQLEGEKSFLISDVMPCKIKGV